MKLKLALAMSLLASPIWAADLGGVTLKVGSARPRRRWNTSIRPPGRSWGLTSMW